MTLVRRRRSRTRERGRAGARGRWATGDAASRVVAEANAKRTRNLKTPTMSRMLKCQPEKRKSDRVLVCFPPAGATASCFNGDFTRAVDARCFAADKPCPSKERLPEVENLRWNLVDFARDVARHVEHYVSKGDSLYLYGHSAGAWMAFECARALGERVSGVYVSAARAPCLAHWRNDTDVETPRLSKLDDDDAFWAAFERRYGMSDELRCTSRSMITPFRQDFWMSESYEGSNEKLHVPLTAIGIENDTRTTREMIARWSEHTTGAFCSRWWDDGGEHPHRALIAKPLEFASFLSNEVFFV